MKFKGSSTEDTAIYIIDDHVREEDLVTGYPLSGPAGNYVCSLLGAMEVLDKTRIGSWEGHGQDAIEKDIIECQPKVIIGFGTELLKTFVNTKRRITDVSGHLYNITIKNQTFKYLSVVSPSYILKNIGDNDLTLKFSKDLYKAVQVISGEYHDILSEKDVLSAHSFQEFKTIYEQYFLENRKIAYDIETNARPVFMQDGKIIGFSIGNAQSGVYASLHALDFDIDLIEEKKIFDFLINEIFEKKEKVIIHNTQYERPYTYSCLNYEIGFEKADDTLVMARLLKDPKDGAGLKYQAQKNLEYPDWETDLSTYISGFKGLVDRVIFGPKKYLELWKEISDTGIGIFSLDKSLKYDKLIQEDKDEIDLLVQKIKSPLVDLYTPVELDTISELIINKFKFIENQGGIVDSTIPYNWIPDRLLSKYGAIDAIATYDLFSYFENIMVQESTDKIDLHKGYQNWLEHIYVAYLMERNGLYWNDEVVKKDKDFLTNQATQCMKKMLQSSVFKPLIKEICDKVYKPWILSDYLPCIAQLSGYSVEYSRDTHDYTMKLLNGKKAAKSCIDKISIPQVYESQYSEILQQMFYEEVEKATHYDDLKHLYNPSSSTQSWVPQKILLTSSFTMGSRIRRLYTIASSLQESKKTYSYIEQKFLRIARLIGEPDELKSLYGDNWGIKRRELYEGFCILKSSMQSRVTDPEILNILKDPEPIKISSFDDEGVIDIYNSLLFTGIDQDDTKTWTPEFEWLLDFRLFKKASKLISSYIEGSIGRESVVVVDKNDLQAGFPMISRKREYSQISANEDYLLAAKWSPNTATTGRWRSGFHTLPWGSQVKKYYTSRFPGGTVAAPDYSQMEVRTLAAVSHDKNMLELFRSGRDFHTETACFTGDTRVCLTDGTTPTFIELVEKYRNSDETFEVYSIDDKERVVCGRAHSPRITRRASHLLELRFDNGSVIKCTPDHLFWTEIGYVRADYFQHQEYQDIKISLRKDRSRGIVRRLKNRRIKNSPKRVKYEAKVISVCELETVQDVYDLTVDRYSNFAIDTSLNNDGSMVFVHNCKIYRKETVTPAERRFSKAATFSLLYGSSEKTFAKSYCNGDLDYAKMVYDGFFEAYPEVKKWVEERHQEVQRDHRVSLEISNRFIQINPEGNSISDINSMLRKAQNYPIQSQSADLTGCVIFDIQKYIEENHMKSLIIMYVHDSIEIDIYPFELFKLISKLQIILNEAPMRRAGLPSKADVTLGKSLGHEIDMKSCDHNDTFTDGILVLKGYKDEIYETIETWKTAYKTVEILEEDWKEIYVSIGDLFILKKAYTPIIGVSRYKGTCKVHINYFE